ncbi:MAG: archaeosortase/exosortase family protein [Paludibacter sp.]|nr:archaeosortase/exosortase family protein [Paludibacter sp.]MDD4198172.1 archaeosortase/exosortase family protein [Paludibacter sp.]MDD4426876.1 archaeosortase/exosortase family protein [Paludibacter sp.]
MSKFKLPKKLIPLEGIIYFFVILLVAHFFWKFTMLGDESDAIVTFFGMDLSAGFNMMVDHVSRMVYNVLLFMGYDVQLEGTNILRHDNGVAVKIVWACAGYKQAYIFTSIIAFYKGPFVKKLWFIPAGLVVVYLFNIFRIVMIVASIKENPNSFEFLHEGLYKYLYYAVIFLMWVLWEEKIRGKKKVDSE